MSQELLILTHAFILILLTINTILSITKLAKLIQIQRFMKQESFNLRVGIEKLDLRNNTVDKK